MQRSGFTLVELLVVIAIISILASMAVPAYSKYVAREKLKQAQADLESISLRFEHRYQRILAYPDTALATTEDVRQWVPKWRPTSSASDFNFATVDPRFTGYSLTATGLSGLLENCVVLLSNNGTRRIANCQPLIDDGDWL